LIIVPIQVRLEFDGMGLGGFADFCAAIEGGGSVLDCHAAKGRLATTAAALMAWPTECWR
jgi:hypothetical protein